MTGEAYKGFWWGNLRERDHLRDPGPRWENNIKMDLQEVGVGVWTGLIWLRKERVVGTCRPVMNLVVHKVLGIS